MWHLAVVQHSSIQTNDINFKLSAVNTHHILTSSIQAFIGKVIRMNATISITEVKVTSIVSSVFVDSPNLYLPSLTTVNLCKAAVNSYQVLGLMNCCRHLVDFILQECHNVDDHIFKKYLWMPIEGK